MKTLSYEPHPPSATPPDPVDTNTCCDDPTPGKHGRTFYCEACGTEWVPATWFTKAQELYVVEVATHAGATNDSDPMEILALTMEAGVKFQEALRKHAAEHYQKLTGEPEGLRDQSS